MARKTHEDALGVAGAETIIGSGVIVHGNLASEADIVIDGTLDGQVKTLGNVTIGVNAQVKANVEGTNVTIAGSLVGNINATGEAVILENGRVLGDIRATGIAIASGGVFVGRSIMDTPPRLEPDMASDPDIKLEAPKTHKISPKRPSPEDK